jgi:hypothetical protein
MNKRCVIIGGGVSIRDNLWHIPVKQLPIWRTLKNEFTIGTNFVFHWFIPTVLMYSDYQFYGAHQEQLQKLPLVLGKEDSAYKRHKELQLSENILLLKECERLDSKPHYWGQEAWSKGFYASQLIGIKALNLAIALGYEEIYLLGYDATCDTSGRTHFYSDTNIGSYTWNNSVHTGVGKNDRGYFKTGNYNKIDHLNNFWFKPFEEELKRGINIYNVSVDSKIETFPKITYKEFYKRILTTWCHVDHNQIRNEIKKRLK